MEASAMATEEDVPERAVITAAWKGAIDSVVPCVVVIKVTQTRTIDTEPATSSYATGFVVDKQRGIILTNRHVCTPGPIVAEAIFNNREEVTVRCIYRDPVHDFGFLMFDPSKLQFMALGEIPLAPEAASVGLDIRVVGNDSGEKMSILAGTIARLDRDAPHYGKKTYNDFNTFYIQAASGTKGGSSGSPVIDCHGRAVGLNAGGKSKAASAFYLPLERVVRILAMLQASKSPTASWEGWKAPLIPRGDLQTTFIFKGFDEVRRLGLPEETEREVRSSPACSHGTAPDTPTTGMLVVESVIPGSPAHGKLEAGDVLVRVGRTIVTHFLQLEEVMDSTVGGKVELQLQRGGKEIEVLLEVTDLHVITPAAFLELAGGSVHQLSYQQARNNSTPISGVYVADQGYMLARAHVPKHAIITALGGKPTPDLPAFAAALQALPHGARVPVEFFVFSDRHRRKNTLLFVDRQWYGPPIYWERDDSQGKWHPTIDYPPGAPPSPEPSAAHNALVQAVNGGAAHSVGDDCDDGSKIVASSSKAAKKTAALEEQLRCCMAMADVHVPLVCLVDGVHGLSFAGTGVVVYHGERVGLVLLDRNTVAVGPCDINLSFGAHPAEVSARARFLHPLHNFALVSYDPRELPPETRRLVHAAELAPGPLHRGDAITLAGVTKDLRVMQRKSVVTNSTLALSIHSAEVPRFRAVHEEVVKLDQDFGNSFSGILTDDEGRVRGIYASYAEQEDKIEREWCVGLPAAIFAPWVRRLAQSLDCEEGMASPAVRVLDAELEPLMLSKAAQYKLPAEWVSRLARVDPERRQVLRVRSTVAGSHASQVLKGGDMILAVNGKPVTCFSDVEDVLASGSFGLSSGTNVAGAAAERAEETPSKRRRTSVGKGGKGPAVTEASPKLPPAASCLHDASGQGAGSGEAAALMTLTVFRSGQDDVQEVLLQPGLEDGMGTNRIVHFCGAQLQAPHRAVREHGFLPPDCSGVFISRWHHGSPSHRYGLFALHFVAEVNEHKTPDLESFVKIVSSLQDGAFVRIKMYQMDTAQPKVITLKLDLAYWPTWELVLDPLTCKWDRRTISLPLP